jgi:aryl-alcohol dehydrogenase-like predicted oxidoreductase
MKYIKYNGEQISKLSLGTVQFGLNYGIANKNGKPPITTVRNILNLVKAKGVNSFDTASAYGDSEMILGKTLSKIQEQLIISKLSSKHFRTNCLNTVNITLNNLKTNRLYGLLMHDPHILGKWNSTDDELVHALKNSSKIKHFGVSIYSSNDFHLALENKSIDLIQIPFNIFDQRALKEGWFEKAQKKNKLIFIRSIYLQGLLLMQEDQIPDKLHNCKQYIKFLDSLSKKLNISRNELLVSFVCSSAKNSIILFGCETLSQAKENLDIFSKVKELDSEVVNQITETFQDIDETIYNPSKW